MEGQDKIQDANQPFKDESSTQNYQKLKRKYKALREEYLRVLENWEDTQRTVKELGKERKFLREKLECFLKSQHFNVSDETLTAAIMAKNNDVPTGTVPYASTSSTKISNLQGNQIQAPQQSQKRIKKEHHLPTHSSQIQHQTFTTQNMSSKSHMQTPPQMVQTSNQNMPQPIMMAQSNGAPPQMSSQQPPMQMMMDVQGRGAQPPTTFQIGIGHHPKQMGNIADMNQGQIMGGSYKHSVQHS